jgi:hypothetical protein
MSELDQAMEKHMAYLVDIENRPFCYRDFMVFEVEEKEYRMSHGTYRNKITALKKTEKVELAYNAGIAFHTLKGKRFGRTMTPNHTVVCHHKMDSFSRFIYNLPTDKAAVHDIRLKFQAQGIWSKLSYTHPESSVNQRSKDMCIPTWKIGDLLVRTIIHKSDTVSVIVACSLVPVAVNFNGIIELSNALTRVHERLTVILRERDIDHCGNDLFIFNDNSFKNGNNTQRLNIPDPKNWIVTMWHFGKDSLVEYTEEKFAVTWEDGQGAFLRAYTKVMKDKKTRIRLERQEYPRKTLQAAVEEKIDLEASNQHMSNNEGV